MSAFVVVFAILAVGFIIVVHEAGHYVVARWCKMRVDRFSIGFGPPIVSRKIGETDFTIGPIPFGGFVRINGMLVSDEADADDPTAYPNRPTWQRVVTIFAGPATNYLAAFFLAVIFFNIEGVPTSTARYVVGDVAEGFDAKGKLEAGDIIAKVNGEILYLRKEGVAPAKGFVTLVQESGGKPLELTVVRDGVDVLVSVLAAPNPEFDAVRELPPEDRLDTPEFRIGIILTEERTGSGFFRVLGHSFLYPIRETGKMVGGLYELATKKEKRKDATLMGPVGITDMFKKEIERGFIYFLHLLMVLNVWIGLVNLFPLPALDGGRLVFLVYEMVTRRRANPKIEAMVHMVGILALGLLLIVVTYKDCQRVFF